MSDRRTHVIPVVHDNGDTPHCPMHPQAQLFEVATGPHWGKRACDACLYDLVGPVLLIYGEHISYETGKRIMHSTIYRQAVCLWCGAELHHSPKGRPKMFCKGSCRASYNRALKRWARQSIDAVLAGDPEPPPNFAQPVQTARYYVDPHGNVTKWPGSGKAQRP